MIACIAGKGGITGIPGDPIFGSPSPIIDLHLNLCQSIRGVRCDILDYDSNPDLDRFRPDTDNEPTVLCGHSFGGDAAVSIAGALPRIASEKGWRLGPIALVLIDPVMQSQWWNPWRPRFEIPACVDRVVCYVRNAVAFPFSSEISGADGTKYVNHFELNVNHNSIVQHVEPEVIDFVSGIFSAWGGTPEPVTI